MTMLIARQNAIVAAQGFREVVLGSLCCYAGIILAMRDFGA